MGCLPGCPALEEKVVGVGGIGGLTTEPEDVGQPTYMDPLDWVSGTSAPHETFLGGDRDGFQGTARTSKGKGGIRTWGHLRGPPAAFVLFTQPRR